MKIHNIMEDIVWSEIESVCESITNDPQYKELCVCPQCRLDVACYVLNRVEPRYLVSGRGLERVELSFNQRQEDTDLITIIFEAFKIVAHNKRPGRSHDAAEKSASEFSAKAYFNLPAIMGRILDGRNFAPMSGMRVSLYLDGRLLIMNNDNWQNPCFLHEKTEGCFTFWPESLAADVVGEEKTVELELKAEAEGYEPLAHYFEVRLSGEREREESVSMRHTLRLPSLYVFPPEEKS